MNSVYNTLRGAARSLLGSPSAKDAAAAGPAAGAAPDEAIVLDEDEEPQPKRPRGGASSGCFRSGAPNKFEGAELLERLGGGASHGVPKPLSTAAFYAPAISEARAAAGAAALQRQLQNLQSQRPPAAAAAAAAPRAAPPRALPPPRAPRAAELPLEISDDEDAPLKAAARPRDLYAPGIAPGVSGGQVPVDTVVVESHRAWVGTRKASFCRLTFSVESLELQASFADGGEAFYTMPAEGFIERLWSGYRATDEASWPEGWSAMVAVEASGWPDEDIHPYYDPRSQDPQRRALCCLFLDNDVWFSAQRGILLMNSWRGKWKRMTIYLQDDLMVGRKEVTFFAGTKRSARQRAKERRAERPLLDAPFDYPPGDPAAITLTNTDLQRLDVSEFLNDNLVDFCLKRLQEELAAQLSPAELQRRFHFFNCFFFKKLAADEDPSDSGAARRGRGAAARADAAYARVRKWTARADLFAKDFLIIPVNQSLHWTLAIVCHPGVAEQRGACKPEVHDLTTDVIEIEDDPNDVAGPSPVIIQLNSMNGTHANVEGVVRDYLAREWAARRKQPLERGLELFGPSGPVAFHRASVPQQDNFCDCGLFLIEFARRFCLSAPTPHLSTRAVDGWPYMLRPNWFTPEEAGEAKRDAIRAEVLALAASHAQASGSALLAAAAAVPLPPSFAASDVAAPAAAPAAAAAVGVLEDFDEGAPLGDELPVDESVPLDDFEDADVPTGVLLYPAADGAAAPSALALPVVLGADVGGAARNRR